MENLLSNVRKNRVLAEAFPFLKMQYLNKRGIPVIGTYELVERKDETLNYLNGTYLVFTVPSWAGKLSMKAFSDFDNVSFTQWDTKKRGQAKIYFKYL